MRTTCSLIFASGALLTALLASSRAAADDRKRVNIDARVEIAGQTRPGVVVKVGTEWAELAESMGFEPDAAVALTNDSNRRIPTGAHWAGAAGGRRSRPRA
jgi:hypothetical protein